MVADGKARAGADLHARAIAVIPRFAGMRDDLALPFQLAIAQQRLFQDGALVLKLRRVSGVLIVAAATASEIRAWRFFAILRPLHNPVKLGDGKDATLLHGESAYFFT